MMIGATTVENLDILNKIVQSEGEEEIAEMKIQRASDLGNKEKQLKIIMMKWVIYVSWSLAKLVR